jgi:hypothetical protein
VVAQLEMHGLVVPVQLAFLGESLVAFGALKVLARLAFVNSGFVVAQLRVVGVPSQTNIALRSVVAIVDWCIARLLVLLLDLLLDLAQRRRRHSRLKRVNLFASLFVSRSLSCSSCHGLFTLQQCLAHRIQTPGSAKRN